MSEEEEVEGQVESREGPQSEGVAHHARGRPTVKKGKERLRWMNEVIQDVGRATS